MPKRSVVLHAEVCQRVSASAGRISADDIGSSVKTFLSGLSSEAILREGSLDFRSDEFLSEHIHSLELSSDGVSLAGVKKEDVAVHIHVYSLNESDPDEEVVEDEGQELTACQRWSLPSVSFAGLWDSLVFDDGIKEQLMKYSRSAMYFADKGVRPDLVSWNRVVLLHGPPGTGKTTLCRALAQKLAIRCAYPNTELVEVNTHSLFSKWFSESGKLVMKMFHKIIEIAEDPETLVIVMIDEVESLTAARKHAMSGNEPSDALRVVNAVLTQIDNLRRYPNVLLMCTSNITGAIDLAFVDRADIKQYIGNPTKKARYLILKSCIEELIRVGIVTTHLSLLDLDTLSVMSTQPPSVKRSRAHKAEPIDSKPTSAAVSATLFEISEKADGLSGRALRKMPFLAHALYATSEQSSLEEYLICLSLAIDNEFKQRQHVDGYADSPPSHMCDDNATSSGQKEQSEDSDEEES